MAYRARRGRVRVRWSADSSSAVRGGGSPAGYALFVFMSVAVLVVVAQALHLF